MRAVGLSIVLVGALAVMSSGLAQAQTQSPAQDSGASMDPNQYTQEDSHPVRIVGYILSPVGTVLEWGIARPLHYLATQSFLQPLLDPARDSDEWLEFYGGGAGGVPPLPPVPSATAADQADQTEHGLAEKDLGTERLLPQPGTAAPSNPGETIPPAPKNAGQPELH